MTDKNRAIFGSVTEGGASSVQWEIFSEFYNQRRTSPPMM